MSSGRMGRAGCKRDIASDPRMHQADCEENGGHGLSDIRYQGYWYH